MKKTLVFWVACLFLFSAKLELAQPQKTLPNREALKSNGPSVVPDFGKVPLYFIPNQGQVDERALYYAKASRYTLWLTKGGLIFDSIKRKDRDSDPEVMSSRQEKNGGEVERDVSRLEFLNSNQGAEVVPVEMTEHRANYFIGNNPEGWKTDIETSKAVLYRGIYENIDLKVYGVEKQLEYDWVVKPGGDVGDIRFRYRDVKGAKIDGEGDLLVDTRFGEFRHKKPAAYQVINGERVEVAAEFKKTGEGVYGFATGEYDNAHELIIDPMVLVYSTYLGGSGEDAAYQVAIDAVGCAHVTGYTQSSDFPLVNAYDSTRSGIDVFVTKFAADGSSLIYSTYIGGTDYEYSRDITIGGQVAFIAGYTFSSDFPMDTEVDSTFAGDSEAFVVMLSYAGNNLLLSTYLGGSGTEEGYSIYATLTGSVGSTDYYDIYVTGNTASSDFPLQGAYDSALGGLYDAFVTKIAYSIMDSLTETDSAGIIYSTYLGGTDEDYGFGIDVDNGYAYVTGYTLSTDFPTQYGLAKAAGSDAFITEFSQDGTSLEWSTYLGGSGTDRGYSIAIDSGGVVIAGETTSTNFPMANPYDSSYGGNRDDYLAKVRLLVDHTDLVYSSYLGGSGDDAHLEGSMTLDQVGDIYLAGFTNSTDFPLANAVDSSISDYEAFVAKFHFGTLLELRYSTFLGGSGNDRGYGIAVDDNKDIYVVGGTDSSDFPVGDAYQGTSGGGRDAFLTKLRIPSPKTDFNGDEQEDILWRYYGPGGHNAVWYMCYYGPGGIPAGRPAFSPVGHPGLSQRKGPGRDSAKDRDFPKDKKSVTPQMIDMLAGKEPPQVYWDAREVGGLLEKSSLETVEMGIPAGVRELKDPREMAGAGDLRIQALGLTYLGADSLPAVTDTNWQIAGTGDFDADGKPDILWRHYGVGYNVVWYMDGVTYLGADSLPAVTDTNWQIAGTGDFNADGKLDILWRHYGVGNNVVWYMDGVTCIGAGWLPALTDTNWQIAGTGDFNADGKLDILWRHYVVGNNVVWYMDGVNCVGADWLPAVTDMNWRIAGTGDFNKDANPDILWRYYGAGGHNVVWYMDGVTYLGADSIPALADINWRIQNH